MGLFSKKDPCAICGGKVSGLFPPKIDGHLICKDCHGDVDLPDGVEKSMSLDQFKEYMAFREENDKLKRDFVKSEKADFGLLSAKVLMDYEHGRFCLDGSLLTTVFLAEQLVSFRIKEDSAVLYNVNADELAHYRSTVPERAMMCAPMIDQYHHMRHMHEMEARNRKDGDNPPPPPPFNAPILVDNFIVELELDHPYWGYKEIVIGAPRIDENRPDLNEFMSRYNDACSELEKLAVGLAWIAFPKAVRKEL